MGRLSPGLFLLLALAAACGWSVTGLAEPRYQTSAPVPGKAYLFVVYQPDSALHLLETFGPLIDQLNRSIKVASFQLETSPDYDEFARKMAERQFDFALANPRQTLDSLHHGYHVIAKMADDPRYTSIILVRRDSGIRQVNDLIGKKVAYPNRNCLRGTILPQYYLQTHGLDVNRDIENLYVGSHESAIMNVYLGNVAAAGVKRPAWERYQYEHPEQAKELVAQWETGPLINPAVVARDDVPPELAARVARVLVSLDTTEEGRAILERIPISRFEPADNSRYRSIENFLRRVEQTLHPRKAPSYE